MTYRRLGLFCVAEVVRLIYWQSLEGQLQDSVCPCRSWLGSLKHNRRKGIQKLLLLVRHMKPVPVACSNMRVFKFELQPSPQMRFYTDYRSTGLRLKTPVLPLVSVCGPAAGAPDLISSLLENGKVDRTVASGEGSEGARTNSNEDAADSKTLAKQKKKRSKGVCLSMLWTRYALKRLLRQCQYRKEESTHHPDRAAQHTSCRLLL